MSGSLRAGGPQGARLVTLVDGRPQAPKTVLSTLEFVAKHRQIHLA
jgi:hypothetical protein